MSVQALSCAFAVRGLSSSEKLVLLALANFADDKMRCWPSQERLARDTELSERTIWGALKSLEGQRLVTRQARKRADGTRSTDVFTLCFAPEATTQPVANPAKTTRKPCESQSQSLQDPVAPVATLTTFEPPIEEPSKVEPDRARPAPRRARRVPDLWLPSQGHFELGAVEGLSPGEIERELAKFRDHEFDRPKTDWDATFRKWLRTAAERKPRGANVRPPPDHKRSAREENLARAFAGSEIAFGGRRE